MNAATPDEPATLWAHPNAPSDPGGIRIGAAGVRRVHPVSLCSFGFIWFHLGAFLWSSGSSVFAGVRSLCALSSSSAVAGLIGLRPVGRIGSSLCALYVDEGSGEDTTPTVMGNVCRNKSCSYLLLHTCILHKSDPYWRIRLGVYRTIEIVDEPITHFYTHYDSIVRPWGLSGSSGVVGVRPGGRRVHPVSLGALWVSSYSSVVTWFNWVRPWCRRVHLVSLGSLGCAQGVVGFIQSHWYIGVQPGSRRVHPGSLGSLGCALGVLRFILVHLSAPRGSSGLSGVLGSSGVAVCTGVRPERRRVQLGSLRCAQGVVVFIQVCWVFLGAPWGSLV